MKISTQFVTIVTSTAIAGLLIFSNVVQAQDGRGNNNARNQADNRGDNRNNRNNNPNNIEEVEEVIETPEEIEEVEEIPEEVIEVVEPVTIPSSIEAELFTTQEGIRLEDGIQDGDSHVAYIQDGDFTEYNIVVPNNGNYNIEAIVASNTNGGTITIEVNGIDINSMDVSNTGGWQNWTTVSTNLELEAGEQTLRLAYSGGNSYLLNVDAFTIAFGEAIETPVEPVVEEPAIETVNTIASIAALGELIFTDTNLSLNRTQSCSTCHNPDNGWIDDRDNGINSSVSLGDDEISLGNRNSPTIAYAAFIPDFNGNNRNANGGLFWDGRAEDLVSQAGQPFTNPIEMGMPDENSVIDRILENPEYVAAFEDFFGDGVFDNTNTAFTAVSEAIATFEESDTVNPFDSKYDRHVAGTYQMTEAEEDGMDLFFSNGASCNNCHQLNNQDETADEMFTEFDYENVGVPANEPLNSLLASLGQLPDFLNNSDQGLFENPNTNNNNTIGLFRIPTLRNVGVTGPYFHNGVFQNLQTVIHFYDHQGGNNNRDTNPETGQVWGDPESPNTISNNLNMGNLNNNEVDNLECFLRTLTDAQFESELPPLRNGLDCS